MTLSEAPSDAQEDRRPYAATANVVAVLQRARTRNLPETIDDDFYRLVDIPDVVFGRVREALRFLDMIGPNDRPTDRLNALSASSDEEYRDLLAAAIRDAYRDDFARIDPAQDTQVQIVNAFRRYQPRSQTSRMVMLFLGLCREAGIPVLDAPRERSMRTSQSGPKKQQPRLPKNVRVYGGGGVGRVTTSAQKNPDVLFGVTEADIAALDENEFQEVWSALGKVARARARATKEKALGPTNDGEELRSNKDSEAS